MITLLRKKLILTSLLLFVCPQIALAESNKLNIGIFYLAPHMIIDEEREVYSGAAVEYFAKIAEEMQVEYKVRGYPFPRLMKMLYSGEIDAALFLAKNEDRANHLGYPKLGYFETESVLAVTDDSPLGDLSELEVLRGLIIGTTSKVFKTPSMRHDWLIFEYLTGGKSLYWQHFNKLQKGRIDAVYFPDKAALMFEARRANVSKSDIRYLTLPDPKVDIYTVFSDAVSAEYLPQYEEAARKVMSEQTYQQFLLEYIINSHSFQ
ncbi:transporter substrate-binding domain-containing protein [Vibrio europaeus]|nr:transporter substrate-binding domain-containing protein [Vibrio europaeus]